MVWAAFGRAAFGRAAFGWAAFGWAASGLVLAKSDNEVLAH